MKLARPIIFGTLLAVAFFAYTTHRFGGSPVQLINRSPIQVTEAASPVPLDSEEQNNIEVYKKVSPSVVNITSTAVAFDFFYGAVPQEGQGSGFIIDKEGHILTNYHVIADARDVWVTLHNRRKYRASIVGSD